MIYVLNLTADLLSSDGFFSPNPNRYWTKQDPTNPNNFIAANGSYADSSADTWGPTLNQNQGDQMQLGVFFSNPSGVTHAELIEPKLYVTFSRRRRDSNARRLVATPFFANGFPRTILGADSTPLAGAYNENVVGYFLLLQAPNIPSRAGTGNFKFEFSVVANVTYRGAVRSYSYDPELDVDILSK